MNRTVVCVGVGQQFQAGVDRLRDSLPAENLICWKTEYPPNTLPDPFAFKVSALEFARGLGFDAVLWADASMVAVKPLDGLWDLIETQGYWFSRNYDYMTYNFTADSAYPALFPKLADLDAARRIAKGIPQVIASCFGLDFRSLDAQAFFREWKRMAEDGAFAGPKYNFNGEASPDPEVVGHRHDQTAASVAAWKLGMTLTDPPKWLSEEGKEIAEDTVFTMIRCR